MLYGKREKEMPLYPGWVHGDERAADPGKMDGSVGGKAGATESTGYRRRYLKPRSIVSTDSKSKKRAPGFVGHSDGGHRRSNSSFSTDDP